MSPKIREACAVARKNGYRYIWIDSCCIDKSSSSELSEAINSMFKWYSFAAVCYAYLADVPPGTDPRSEASHFRRTRWFTRGWTLQELLAPRFVEFLSEDWAPIGSKHTLADIVETVTMIDYKALLHHQGTLDQFSVAQRLSWAANRETTREEDRAYSLLGIFDINMPTLYGEGDRAFRRLQEHIMQRIPDQSLLAWGDVYPKPRPFGENPHPPDPRDMLFATARPYSDQHQNLFARLPDDFKNGARLAFPPPRDLGLLSRDSPHRHSELEYTSTPYGIRTQLYMIPLTHDLLLRAIPDSKEIQLTFKVRNIEDEYEWYLAILKCGHSDLPGNLLGRVCYIPYSSSEVDVVYTGTVDVSSPDNNLLYRTSLFPLTPDTVNYCHPHTVLKTVYLRHPERPDPFVGLLISPHTIIQLVLLKENRFSLHCQGYSAEFRHPNQDHPTTHRLTLSALPQLNDDHTITVEFHHTLAEDGRQFTIQAEVAMSNAVRIPYWDTLKFIGKLDPELLQPEYADDPTGVSRTDAMRMGWLIDHCCQKVRFETAGGVLRTMGIELRFVGAGVYMLRMYVCLRNACYVRSE